MEVDVAYIGYSSSEIINCNLHLESMPDLLSVYKREEGICQKQQHVPQCPGQVSLFEGPL